MLEYIRRYLADSELTPSYSNVSSSGDSSVPNILILYLRRYLNDVVLD